MVTGHNPPSVNIGIAAGKRGNQPCLARQRSATRRAVDAANAFGIDERTLTSHNALIPVAYYLSQHPNLTLFGESAIEAENAVRVRIWLPSALINGVFGGSSDLILSQLRETLRTKVRGNGDFPIAELNQTVMKERHVEASDAIEQIMNTKYQGGGDKCRLPLSLLYDDRNWDVIEHSVDHLFPQDMFRGNVSTEIKSLRHDFANLALVKASENSQRGNRPLHDWLGSRGPDYLRRHLIPVDSSLWHFDRFEDFLRERRVLLRRRLQRVLLADPDAT